MSRKKITDIEFKDGSKIFFTSDTHFGHEPIIKFCNRPFSSVEEMDDILIKNWNEIVPEDGLVFHLGDFAWSKKWEIRDKLNGEIILIEGNHDKRSRPQSKAKYDSMFSQIKDQLFIEIEGRKILLNHYPLLCYAGTYRDKNALVYNLHGHTHYGKLSTDGRDNERLKICFPTQYDVGVDNNDFKPIPWKDIDAIIKKQIEEKTNYCGIKCEV